MKKQVVWIVTYPPGAGTEHFRDGTYMDALRAFSTWDKAAAFVGKEARKIPGYDREAELECRAGKSEYACAKLCALITGLTVE